MRRSILLIFAVGTVLSFRPARLEAGDPRAALEGLELYPKKTLMAIVELAQYPQLVERVDREPDSFRTMSPEDVKALEASTSAATIQAIAELLTTPDVMRIMGSHMGATVALGAVYRRAPQLVERVIDEIVAKRNSKQLGIVSTAENEGAVAEVAKLNEQHQEWGEQPLAQNPAAVQQVLANPTEYPNALATLLANNETAPDPQVNQFLGTVQEQQGLTYQPGSSAAYVENLVLNVENGWKGPWTANPAAVAAVAADANRYATLAAVPPATVTVQGPPVAEAVVAPQVAPGAVAQPFAGRFPRFGASRGIGAGARGVGVTQGAGVGARGVGVAPGAGVGAPGIGVAPGAGVGAPGAGVRAGAGVGARGAGVTPGRGLGAPGAGLKPGTGVGASGRGASGRYQGLTKPYSGPNRSAGNYSRNPFQGGHVSASSHKGRQIQGASQHHQQQWASRGGGAGGAGRAGGRGGASAASRGGRHSGGRGRR